MRIHDDLRTASFDPLSSSNILQEEHSEGVGVAGDVHLRDALGGHEDANFLTHISRRHGRNYKSFIINAIYEIDIENKDILMIGLNVPLVSQARIGVKLDRWEGGHR